ncbi:MAG: arylsulfatase [Kiritimatiellia bacterium]
MYILADDLGYGDVHHLNPQRGKIATPNLDRLAARGLVFTEAHSGSSVCTPTRYGILTGRYAWRTRLQNGVLHGYSPPLIAPDRLTVPGLLRRHGYTTACIGKWHLGMDLPRKADGNPVSQGPLSRGFDRYFGISASLDMPPFAFIENDRFTEEPTVEKEWLRKGAAAPGFEAVDVLPELIRHAGAFLRERVAAKTPFFLYLPLNSPHTPLVPAPAWRGKSGLGDYGDFVMQTDAAVGEVLRTLDELAAAANTLVIFTSDNGCSPAAGVERLEQQGHFASANRRGYKADIFDGGHRIPFIARWPAVVKAGTTNDQAVCLTDLMATCADLVGTKLPDNAGEDSFSLLPVLRGTGPSAREAVVHHSINGSFALRQDKWKIALCADSGGWSKPGPKEAAGLPKIQLYDTESDPGETRNLADLQPETRNRLTLLLEKIVNDGRSTPGLPQKNDVQVSIRKT